METEEYMLQPDIEVKKTRLSYQTYIDTSGRFSNQTVMCRQGNTATTNGFL